MNWNPISAAVEAVAGVVTKYFPDELTRKKVESEIYAQTAGLQLQHDKMTQELKLAILADVGSARQLQSVTKSKMPGLMTMYALVLFTLVLVWAAVGDKIGFTMPEAGTRHDIIMMAITLIIREVIAAFAFWMGSSESSKSKDATIAAQIGD